MVAIGRRVARLAACLLLLAAPAMPAFADDKGEPPYMLPSSIQVDPLLDAVVAQMLERSPTFRRQCRAIEGMKGVVVAVHLVPTPRNLTTHAHATLRRYSSGLMIAQVEVPAASPLAELIGHEFEHITEFIEGVDLDALAAAHPSEAVKRTDGSFETWRAVAAGKAVRDEVSGRASSR